MRKLDHQNIVKLRFFFYSSGDKVGAVVVCVVYCLEWRQGLCCDSLCCSLSRVETRSVLWYFVLCIVSSGDKVGAVIVCVVHCLEWRQGRCCGSLCCVLSRVETRLVL